MKPPAQPVFALLSNLTLTKAIMMQFTKGEEDELGIPPAAGPFDLDKISFNTRDAI
jgi:hypothetical protein